MNTWTKTDNGWGVKIENPTDHAEHMVGFPTTVYTRSGERRHVVLGAHVRTFRVKGGNMVYVFEVDDAGTARIAGDWAADDARYNARIRRQHN